MFQGHPVFGVGPDMYSDYHHLTAHNSFVLVMAETGIIGFMVFLALIIYSFRMMWAGSRPAGTYAWDPAPEDAGPDADVDADPDAEDDDADGRQLALALLIALAGFFTCAFFLSRSYVVILYLLLALVVAHYGNLRDRNPALPAFSFARELLVWPFIAVGGVVGLYIVVKILLVFP
jgi:O-antigen ligase